MTSIGIPWQIWPRVGSLRLGSLRRRLTREPEAPNVGDREAADADTAEDTEERSGGGGGESPYVTVYVATSMEVAYLALGRLQSEDIPAMIRRDTFSSLYAPVVRGFEVQVPRTLAERAEEVLEGF